MLPFRRWVRRSSRVAFLRFYKTYKHTDTDAVILLELKEVPVVEKDAVRLVRRAVRTIRVKLAACNKTRFAFRKHPDLQDPPGVALVGPSDAKRVAWDAVIRHNPGSGILLRCARSNSLTWKTLIRDCQPVMSGTRSWFRDPRELQ